MSYQNLTLEASGPVVTVTVNRPKVLNALDGTTVSELVDVFSNALQPAVVRCVVLTGAGDKAFVAGADIAAMANLDAAGAKLFAESGHRLAAAMEGAEFPIIAAVNGFALGGGLELALACDFILASSNAKVGLPEVGLGVIPGFGGTQRLARRVGLARARELVYTGQVIAAEEAARIGLVNAVVEPADLIARARAIAEVIASRAPLAVASAKRAMREGADLPLPAALSRESTLFADLFTTADQKEGMQAFLQKRPAKFERR